jgi:protein TonB
VSEETAKKVRLDEKVRAQDLLYASMFHTEDRGILFRGFIVAVVIHVVFLFIHFPQFRKTVVPEKKENVVYVRKYTPPPPKIEKKQIVRKKLTRKVPIPDPTPDEPEPIREPEPEIEPEVLPPDAEFLIGEPEPPPPTGPLIAGVGGVTEPKRIPESYVQPAYPELARKAKIEGKVILQAVVTKEGVVSELKVLRCNRPGLGFEDSAVAAVRQWRYEPASQNGRPVDVFITVIVDFTLQ